MSRNLVLAQSTREFCELTKGSGLKHTLIAPCYPRRNDQAERLVQNVGQLLRRKEAFQSSKILVRCLFSYETNSTTYTNCLANKYFFQFFRKVLSWNVFNIGSCFHISIAIADVLCFPMLVLKRALKKLPFEAYLVLYAWTSLALRKCWLKIYGNFLECHWWVNLKEAVAYGYS